MSTPNSTNPPDYYLEELSKITGEIVKQSSSGNYIYRGEPETYNEKPDYGKVSSTLYRKYPTGTDSRTLSLLQQETLNDLKGYLSAYEQKDNFEILTELQHYGIETNLIDFTSDYHIALFFACNGSHDKDGRVILLKITDEINIKYQIKKPLSPQNRVIAQKSIFAQPPKGYLDFEDITIIPVPANLKQWILIHLRKFQDISTKSIFNDLHGFIQHRNLTWSDEARQPLVSADKRLDTLPPQRPSNEELVQTLVPAIRSYNSAIQFSPYDAKIYFNQAFCYAHLGDKNRARAIEILTKAIMLKPDYAQAYTLRALMYSLGDDHVRSILDYNSAKTLDSDYPMAYFHCGIEWLILQKWDNARFDLLAAKEKGEDIVATFCRCLTSVKNFEQKHDVKLPQDIAAMLQPVQPPQT